MNRQHIKLKEGISQERASRVFERLIKDANGINTKLDLLAWVVSVNKDISEIIDTSLSFDKNIEQTKYTSQKMGEFLKIGQMVPSDYDKKELITAIEKGIDILIDLKSSAIYTTPVDVMPTKKEGAPPNATQLRDKKNGVKIMVGSTVYGFENELSAIIAQLYSLGYSVLNSHAGTIRVNPNLSNLENCLAAVRECDLFLGIIRPYYGTGNIGDKNITFEEIKLAIELKKPYWFLVHRDVTFARNLFKKVKKEVDNPLKNRENYENTYHFDPRCIEVYEHVIKSGKPVELRNGNWAQEFYRLDEAMTYINTQFSDNNFVSQVLEKKEETNGK